MPVHRTLWTLLPAVTLAGPLVAQEAPGPLITDRPDQTESASVVPRGLVQLEAGWVMSREAGGGSAVTAHAVPGALVRIGALPALEARVGFAGWMRTAVAGAGGAGVATGVGDLDLGLKYRLAHGAGAAPAVAVIGTVTLPTGDAGFGHERAAPSARVALAHVVSDRVGVGYNLGVSGTPAGAATAWDALYTLVLGVAVAQSVGVFVESFGAVALNEAGEGQHGLDGGFTLQLSPKVQLDASGGVGLNVAAADWFVGAGLSVRLPR